MYCTFHSPSHACTYMYCLSHPSLFLSLPLSPLQNITSLIPDFYNHIGYVDYSGMPFPPLSEAEFSEEEEDQVETEEDQVETEEDKEDEASVLFQTVSEKSMSFSVDMLKCVTDDNESGEVLLVSGSETVEDELELTVGDDEEENALETKGKEPIVLCVEEKKGQNEESVHLTFLFAF